MKLSNVEPRFDLPAACNAVREFAYSPARWGQAGHRWRSVCFGTVKVDVFTGVGGMSSIFALLSRFFARRHRNIKVWDPGQLAQDLGYLRQIPVGDDATLELAFINLRTHRSRPCKLQARDDLPNHTLKTHVRKPEHFFKAALGPVRVDFIVVFHPSRCFLLIIYYKHSIVL